MSAAAKRPFETPPSVLNVERKLSIGFDLERFFVVNLYVSPPPTCWTISNARQGFQYCNLGITALRLFPEHHCRDVKFLHSSRTETHWNPLWFHPALNVAAHRLPSGI
jgi:hypothetical protein